MISIVSRPTLGSRPGLSPPAAALLLSRGPRRRCAGPRRPWSRAGSRSPFGRAERGHGLVVPVAVADQREDVVVGRPRPSAGGHDQRGLGDGDLLALAQVDRAGALAEVDGVDAGLAQIDRGGGCGRRDVGAGGSVSRVRGRGGWAWRPVPRPRRRRPREPGPARRTPRSTLPTRCGSSIARRGGTPRPARRRVRWSIR